MPKLWNKTIETHRREVRDAVLDTAAALVARHGVRSVTMSQIAEVTGIGRATLYKYFPDIEAILLAWHERQISRHLDQLAQARARAGDAAGRLKAVIHTYAFIQHEHHGSGQHSHHLKDPVLVDLLHTGGHRTRAYRQVKDMIRDLLKEAAATGDIQDDIPPDELANYCLHALSAASGLPSKAAVDRLVAVTLAGMRPLR